MPDAITKANRYRWLIFWILAISYILVYFHRLCPAVVAVDMMRDLHTGGALLGFLGAAYFYPYAAMQLPAGLLSDSWGPRRTITLFFIIACVGSVILGSAPSVIWAIVGRTLVGLGVSMLFVPTMKVLAEWFRIAEFATMAGILMAMGGIGSLTAASPLAFLSDRIGWRMSFFLVAIMTGTLALLVWLFVRDRPSELGWPSPADSSQNEIETPGLLEGMKKVLTTGRFWPVAIWFFFNCAVFFSFGGLWGGPYLIHICGLSKSEAGHILSMLAVGMIVGSPLLSFISNRVFLGRKPVIVLSSAVMMVITAMLAFWTDALSKPMLYFLCLGLGIFSSAVVVIGFTTTKELFPVKIAGTSTGLINIFPFAGGAVSQPVLGAILESRGRVGDAFTVDGYERAFLALFISAIVAFGASLWLQETYSKDN